MCVVQKCEVRDACWCARGRKGSRGRPCGFEQAGAVAHCPRRARLWVKRTEYAIVEGDREKGEGNAV